MSTLLTEITSIADRLRTELLQLESGSRDWEVLAEQEDVIGTRSPDLLTVRSQGEVAVSITSLFDFINDPGQLSKWNGWVSTHEVIATLDANTDIIHRVFTLPGLPPSDYIYFARRTRESNGSVMQVCHSIDYRPAPEPAQGHVRQELLNYSYLLRKLSDSTTNVTMVTSLKALHIKIEEEELKKRQTEDSMRVLLLRKAMFSDEYTARSTARTARHTQHNAEAHEDEEHVLIEKLDEEFFRQLLSQVHSGKDLPGGEKFEIYLSDRLLPVLLPAIEALSKETERFMTQKEKIDPRVRSRFNPCVWLAEFLMRNNPNYIQLSPAVAENYRSQQYLQKAKKFY